MLDGEQRVRVVVGRGRKYERIDPRADFWCRRFAREKTVVGAVNVSVKPNDRSLIVDAFSEVAQAIEGRNAISPDKTHTVPPDFHKVMDFYETGRRIRVYTLPMGGDGESEPAIEKRRLPSSDDPE